MKDPQKARELFEQLLRADRTEEVTDILKGAGYRDRPEVWRLLGDRPDNYSTAGAQAGVPEAALVEKVTNAIDAVLMRKCLEECIAPTGPEAPQSVRQAVARFFEENPDASYSGDIIRWDNPKIRSVAREHIAISLTGNRRSRVNRKQNYPSITIVDRGEGQAPENQPNTLLSLERSLKRDIGFQHGKFNMGGTAALRFCENGYQLVLSKRAPSLAQKEGATTDWGFTVVRKQHSPGDRMSTFRYLAPVDSEANPGNGEIMRFHADDLRIWPRAKDAYHDSCNSGTLIKLYQYQTKFRTNFGQRGGLRHQLDSWLPRITLPVRLHECRWKEADPRSTEWNLSGLARTLYNARDMEFTNTGKMIVEGQSFSYEIFCLHEDNAETYRGKHGVIFSVAGQSHGTLEDRFFIQKAINFGALRKSLTVILDCSEVDVPRLESLTVNSRDRLSESEFRIAVESQLVEVLKHHPDLRRLNRERKDRELGEKLANQKPFEMVFREIMRHSDVLKSMFLPGERLADQSRIEQRPSQPFQGRKHPSEFHWEKIASGSILERDCQIDRKTRLALVTDVRNDYFQRPDQPGEHELTLKLNGDDVKPSDVTYILNLHDGYAHLNLTLPNSVEVGDTLYAKLSITDDVLLDPFINEANLKIIHKQEGSGGGGSRRSRDTADDKSARQAVQSAGIRFPEVIPVEKEDWNKRKMDAFSAMRVENLGGEAGGPTEYRFFINIDNRYLLAELRSRKGDFKVIRAQWQYTLVFLGLGLLRELDKRRDVKGEQAEKIKEELIGPITDAIAPMVIPIVRNLGSLDSKDIQESE